MMFNQDLPKTFSRVRRVSLAALVGLLATSAGAAAAEANTGPAGEAVIASTSGVSIDTTSGSAAPPRASTGRSSSKAGNALTLNSSLPVTTSNPSRPAVTRSPSASQVEAPRLEAPIVGSPGRRQTSLPPLAQIQSTGPIVAASGSPYVAGHASHRAVHSVGPVWSMTSYRRHALRSPIPVSSTVEISVPGVQVLISPTSARSPSAPWGARRAPVNPAVVQQVGAPAPGPSGLLPTGPRPVPAPGGPGNTTLFGNASGPAGGTALLGIDALLTIAVLLVGAAWRRRSWDLPVLPSQSALLALALDRPG